MIMSPTEAQFEALSLFRGLLAVFSLFCLSRVRQVYETIDNLFKLDLAHKYVNRSLYLLLVGTTMSAKYLSKQGKYPTASLFRDRWTLMSKGDQTDATEAGLAPRFYFNPIFHTEGLESFKEVFVSLMDPTGYKWAESRLGSWEHFKRLMKCSWFREEVDAAVDEIKTIFRTQALDNIRVITKDEEAPQATKLAAARYLAEAGWEARESKRGRPSKAEVQGALKRETEARLEGEEDLARIGGLSVINGGKTN